MFRGAGLVAPRARAEVAADFPLIVAGTFGTASGLGESARLSYRALDAAGIEVFGINLSASLLQPEDASEFAFEDGRGHSGPGTLILHVNGPLTSLILASLGRSFVSEKRVIAYWAWELPKLPADWRHGFPFVHEIWVPSRFVEQAVLALNPGKPVRVAPHPVAVRSSTATARRPGSPDAFTVLTVFNGASSYRRKNPLAAIDAFERAFSPDRGARLIIKGLNLSADPAAEIELRRRLARAPNSRLIETALGDDEMSALYAACDVLLSLHRAEGFGLTLAEAMLHGLPVVAIDWSGNTDFLTPATGVPVPFRLAPATDPQATYHHPELTWAEADVDAAAAALRRLRDDPDEAARLGAAAAAYARAAWGSEPYAAAVLANLGLVAATR